MAPCQVVNLGKDLSSSWTNPPSAQALLSDRVALQSVLLRHVTRGALHSADFPPGPTPLVTGAGERVTVTAFPNQVQDEYTVVAVTSKTHLSGLHIVTRYMYLSNAFKLFYFILYQCFYSI